MNHCSMILNQYSVVLNNYSMAVNKFIRAIGLENVVGAVSHRTY